MSENDFDQIDKGVRSTLQTCLDNLPDIEAWRQTLGLTLRLQLNHPNAVLRRWQASRQTSPGPRNNGRPGYREEVIRLQSELDAAHHQISRLQQGGRGQRLGLAGYAGGHRKSHAAQPSGRG